MKQLLEKLEKAIISAPLPAHSLPYIHGALTADAIGPLFDPDDATVKDSLLCTAIFNKEKGAIPEKGIDDSRIVAVLKKAEDVETEIIDELQDGDFEPFFGHNSAKTPGVELAGEWCRGFLSVTHGQMKVSGIDEPSDDAKTALGVLSAYANSDDPKVVKKIKPLLKYLDENPAANISDSVYEMEFFWQEWETEHCDDEDFYSNDLPGPPVTRENPKTGRNDPCPCNSGKKYKKCCGKTGSSGNGAAEKPGNIIDFPAARGKKSCFICGKTKNLVKTPCCDRWICNDEDNYVLFSYARNSCFRNHSRFTLCGNHFHAGHAGDWKTCKKCREELSRELEMYVWYGTNEYNNEKLPDPPAFSPTLCAKCRKRIVLPEGGYTMKAGKYLCNKCDPVNLPDFA